jgi:hypothetical protein
MVTLESPEFVSVTDLVCVLPNTTVPKPRLVGFEVSTPAAMPAPVNEIVSVPFEALLAIESDPLKVLAESGVNTMLRLAL